MRKNQKITAVVGGTAAAVLVGGVAFAYWSTTGGGTGSAATSAGASNLSIAQTSVLDPMYPGDAQQTIAGTVTNSNAAGGQSQYVNTVTVSITGVTQAPSAVGTCDATDYTLTNATMNVLTDLAPGASANFSGAKIHFNNKASNQDGCKGATVNLAYASN